MTAADATLRELLAMHRARAGLSQTTLALLCGCSRQYIQQLERGERHRPSLRLTTALANSLQLSGAARSRFFAATGHPTGDSGPPVERGELLRLATAALTGLPYPAAIHDSMWRLIAWNEAGLHTFDLPPALMRPGESSLIEIIFDPALRARFTEWESWARLLLAHFKHDSRSVIGQVSNRRLIERLRGLPDFARLWRSVDPAPDATPALPLSYRHGDRQLELRVIRLLLLNGQALWMILFLPANGQTGPTLGPS